MRYPGISFEIETGLFRRTKGETRIKGMDAAQLEAHKNNLPLDERDDYIDDGVYVKELAAWVSSGLRQAGLPPNENYVEFFGRVLVLIAPSGGEVHIICGTMDEPDAKEDGNRHLIGTDPKPTILARVFKSSAFETFCGKVNDTVNRMIAANFEIKLVRKF
jgi:hypothetical protein